jgi:hypothetical protein
VSGDFQADVHEREILADKVRFPRLKKGLFEVTGPAHPIESFNCVAWALERTHPPIWPLVKSPWHDGYESPWPRTIRRSLAVETFTELFVRYGDYEIGDPGDDDEVTAIFAAQGEVRHVARRLRDRRWTSKLGTGQEPIINHATIEIVGGGLYGEVVRVMRRPVLSKARKTALNHRLTDDLVR